MDEAGSLDQLHGIVTPDAVSWWPLQAGWWVVCVLVLAGLAWIALLWLRRHRAEAWRRDALARIDGMSGELGAGGVPVSVLAELPVILRRCAIAAFGRSEGIRFAATGASAGKLADLAYRPMLELDQAEAVSLLAEARRWVFGLGRGKSC